MGQKISMNFGTGRYSDSALATAVRQIIRMMTGNPNFPNPSPSLAELETANNEYEGALEKMKDGTQADTVIKNRRRAALEGILKKEAQYVENVANGDVAIMLSSGFELTKGRVPVGELDVPTNLIVNAGQERGTLQVKFDGVEHARFYEIDYAEVPVTEDSRKERLSNTSPNFLIKGLISGKEYSVRAAAAASKPERKWSKWVSSYVL